MERQPATAAVMVLQAMCGHDPKDSTSADLPVPDFEAVARLYLRPDSGVRMDT